MLFDEQILNFKHKTMRTKFSKIKTNKWHFIVVLALTVMSCSKDDSEDPTSPVGTNPPTELACDYFLEESRTLVNDPEAPVDYVINCIARIKNDVIIEPGVVINFDTGAGLKIEEDGSMVAVGTTDKPILFTGVDKAPGAWAGVAFLSPNVNNKMEYVTIEYGGGEKIHANVRPANITVSYDTRLEINNCTFRSSEEYGMFAYSNTQELHVNNSVFTKNAIPVFSDMTPQLLTVLNASNDYSGNDDDRVYLRAHSTIITTDATWQKINVPYVLSGNLGTAEDLTTLTVEPGVHVFVAFGTEIESGDQTSFQFVGTQQDPIIFEGADPTPGSWDGFRLHNAVNSKMEHMIIAHAGGTNQTFAHESAIGIKYGTTVELNNIHFRDIYGCALKIVGNANNVLMNNISTDNINTGDVDLINCVIPSP